ncbi:MAG TPA: histidine--tRNA ligase [Mollicutes bacterium]|nr:histidine--tRNA ligase [Mollicutes bacterium]
MMIQKPKGTMDLYGDSGRNFIYLQNLINDLCEKYNYEYIKVPMFEASELFHRGVGETTDIVTKETYDFVDRGNRNMTLRPEGTAGVIRSFIENKMYASPNQPVKLYYIGSNFRYERPQSGRLREHTQFGVEVLGTDDEMVDAEIISIAVNLFKIIGLKEVVVKINSLGDTESRENYKEALINHFKPRIDELCDDCILRLEKNPLRVLDCKIDASHELMKTAPKTIDYLNSMSKERFSKVQDYLDALEIEYVVDTNLVRGLDYYSHTVFEIQASIEGFGSQNTICGGGRYNNLVESLGGPSTPGMGFGMGLERLLLALEKEQINLTSEERLDLYIANISSEREEVFAIVESLRLSGFRVETDYLNKNLKGQFKSIERLNPKYFIIIGDDELKSGQVRIKDNDTKEEENIGIYDIIDYLSVR